MATKPNLTELRNTRALAQKLWGQCRDSSNAYQVLAFDLRQLRNLLEDIEEYMAKEVAAEASHRKVLNQIPKFKAILNGLDVSLQSFRCSTQTQQHVPNVTVAAVKASVQIATEGLLMGFHGLSRTANDKVDFGPSELSTSGALPQLTPSEASSDGVLATLDVETATNVTLALENSARIISVGGTSASKVDDAACNDEEPPKSGVLESFQKSVRLPVNWRRPFAMPDPLSLDAVRACTLLTGVPGQAHLVVPPKPAKRAHLNPIKLRPLAVCEPAESSYHHTREGQEASLRSQPAPPATAFPPSKSASQQQRSASETPGFYVPYRPWYTSQNMEIPPSMVDSCSGLSDMTDATGKNHEPERRRASLTPTISVTDYSQSEEEPRVEVLVSKKPQTPENTPPMPSRAPPSPPPPPQIPLPRNKRKPPVSHSRGAYRITNPSSPSIPVTDGASFSGSSSSSSEDVSQSSLDIREKVERRIRGLRIMTTSTNNDTRSFSAEQAQVVSAFCAK